ncbi:auxin efflux carrier component 3a-like [Dendrobium catenatum]|uniref:Auxin efflux carrier component 4 n=1 Tax=Dendrobium catenatum TaxID=906689 RepID=A0A2I0VID3_9ASPA|nr:auxin efflux carrier component 3a-like [Dendrobium catenatum]PKU63161.1 Auxin efflux carrier component 4 [Dendrobium catenatum]
MLPSRSVELNFIRNSLRIIFREIIFKLAFSEKEAEVGGDGKIHVTVRKSTSSRRSISLMMPRPSNLIGAEIYSLSSSRNPTPRGSNFNHSDFFAMCGGARQPPLRHSNFGQGDLCFVQSSSGPKPRPSNFDEHHHHQQGGSPRSWHYPVPNLEIAAGSSAAVSNKIAGYDNCANTSRGETQRFCRTR